MEDRQSYGEEKPKGMTRCTKQHLLHILTFPPLSLNPSSCPAHRLSLQKGPPINCGSNSVIKDLLVGYMVLGDIFIAEDVAELQYAL